MISHKNNRFRLLLVAIVSGVLVGCATTSGARPEDMSAKAHEEEAAREAAKAEEHAVKYDPNAPGAVGSDSAFEGPEFNPTETHNRQAQRHRKHAHDHAEAAEALKRAEEEACGSIAPDSRSWCPLLGPVVASEDTSNGVRITVREGTDVDELVARIRCHLAVANTEGREGMDRCPLYVPGVEVQQSGPNAIELSTKGKASIRELQERVSDHVGD
ncbi:MAG: hypothetical protein KJO57_09535 [Deltaproteobacteria bacterium]|nr:hypothetical protein [Deltaproteobacteria bacterium]